MRIVSQRSSTRRRRRARRFAAVAVAAAWLAGFLALSAVPAQAHITGPQLISYFDGFSSASGAPVKLPGVGVSMLSTGSAPYVTVSLGGAHTFEVLGHANEPFFRLDDQGAQINRNSPSVTFFVNDPAKPIADFPRSVTTTAVWEQVSTQPVYHYYERRAEWPHTGQPQEAKLLGKTATVYRFAIEANYDGTPVLMDGHVNWIPAPFNLELPLLFVPVIIVVLLWIEPKAKGYVRPLATATALLTVAGAAFDATRTVILLTAPERSGGGGLAPLAIVPGLVLLVAVGVPRVRAGQRAAYGWVALFGLYLVVYGLLRSDLFTPSTSSLAGWLHHGELLAGVLVAAGGGLLLFLTSPVRKAPHAPPAGSRGQRPRAA
ncbi:MAG TPA: hypothetical protein VHA57_12695 [Actinomycetota bacterium]|nr:hypothetical protein [Actinomycetota bacterium]